MKRSALQQKMLDDLLLQVADENDVSLQEALRDILTDLRHVARQRGLRFSAAQLGSLEVFQEETL